MNDEDRGAPAATGPVTGSKWHLPKQPWWVWVLIVLGVLMVIGTVLPKSDSINPVIKARYPEWRAECEARATDVVNASGGMYTVGGNRWVSLVNSCITAKADDQVPVP